MRGRKPIQASLALLGKALVEDFDFRRVLVGKVSVVEIKDVEIPPNMQRAMARQAAAASCRMGAVGTCMFPDEFLDRIAH